MAGTVTRRRAHALIAGAAGSLVAAPAIAQARSAVKIGYAISKTGPNTGGAAITVIPNYEMWAAEVNAAGGLKVGDRHLPVEIVQYDDRSSSEEAVRAVERLINQDRVDFVLAPWGTALNLAVGPTLNRAGYPHLAHTAVTDRAPELARRWPNSFWLLGTSAGAAQTLVELLQTLRSEGKIEARVAMASIADGFGIDLSGAGRTALQRAGFQLVYDRTYPVGTQDLAPIVSEIKALNPDVFIAFSYPPDTLALTEQARIAGLNPKVFYTGVGTAFPLYRQRFGANVEGVMGIGGWSADSPAIRDYLARHRAARGGVEPDRWASPVTYASLQMLSQAIERVGLERPAVIRELQTGTFQTILGETKLQNNMPTQYWWVGQWQGGEFYGIAPTSRAGARAPVVPKPGWQST